MDQRLVERLLAEQLLELTAAEAAAAAVTDSPAVELDLGPGFAAAAVQFWTAADACRRRCAQARIKDASYRIDLLEQLLTEAIPLRRAALERRVREAFAWAALVDDEARARLRLVDECCQAVLEITELCGWRGRLAGEAVRAVRQQTQRLCALETQLVG